MHSDVYLHQTGIIISLLFYAANSIFEKILSDKILMMQDWVAKNMYKWNFYPIMIWYGCIHIVNFFVFLHCPQVQPSIFQIDVLRCAGYSFQFDFITWSHWKCWGIVWSHRYWCLDLIIESGIDEAFLQGLRMHASVQYKKFLRDSTTKKVIDVLSDI